MEASSSSAPPIQLGYDYEVFLSFRGKDTRWTFTDHLYTDLKDKGIHTFRDDEELPKGEEIKPELLKAINQSKVSIPIFSKGYASSKWCLMELAQMVKCMKAGSQKILPVFYHVEPNQVRRQEGEYAKAFAEHQEKHPSTVVEEWKTALKTVGKLKGWHLNDNGYEGSLKSEVVLEVFKELKKYQLVDITDNVIGIDDHVDEIMDLLDIDMPDVNFGGIWGMVGSGKTTIAKFMYNQLMHKFDYCSFLSDISDTSKFKGMEILQSQLVSDILGRQGEKLFDVGMGKDTNRFYNKKVLIVLDDVDQADQLNTLFQIIGSVAAGSRIIITTRNRNVLEGKVDWFYEVKEMDAEDALLLFCKHAFKQSFALPKFVDLSREIVKSIGGIPLAIEVVASYLSKNLKDTKAWEEELKRLKRERNIQEKLRVGTNSLNREEKETYLDIACLFHGMDRRIPVPMWEARELYPVRTINDLLAKSLIKVTNGNKLWMHKLLRDLGKDDVRAENHDEPGERSRLWCSVDGVDVLDSQEGTNKVQAICLARDPKLEQRRFTGQDFRKLSQLLFLDLGYANLNGGFERCLRRLKWIGWHGVGLSIPSELHLKDLVVLDLSESSIGENWGGWNSIQEAKKLEVLNLKSCQQLRSTPRFNSFLPIKRLILEDCSELSVVHPSIGQLTALESLNLKKCRSLKSLPEEMESLVELTELVIDEAPIESLPYMENLETLSAKACRSLSQFPEFDNYESLKELNLSHTPVVGFCYSARKLRNLQVLDIRCSLAKCFPPSLEELQKLEVINASGCQSLEGEVPANLGRLTSLRTLRLDNTRITSIPGSIRGLCHLEVLDLGSTECEETLPELPSSIINLRVTCRSSMTVLPNLSDLISLKELEFLECSELAQFPKEFKSLSKLRRLKFHSTSIVDFPVEVGELCHLRELNISDCDKLEFLPELPSGLRRLLISRCSSLLILPKLSSLEKLWMFTLLDCPNVVEIPNLGELKSMRTLRIRGPLATIHGLEMLSSLDDLSLVECLMGNSVDLSMLEGVSNLEVAFCGKLQKIEGLRSLGSLKILKIMNCETLEEVEGIQGLVSVEELWICQCPALKSFPVKPTLKKLRVLNLASCNPVKTLPNLSFMRNLQALNLQILEKLVEVDSLVELVSLETLVISRCTGIETIPNLSMLQQLKTLQLHGLERIMKIPGLDELFSLEILVVSGCNAIETLPNLFRLNNLKTLKLRGLEKVEEIPGLSGLVSLESLAISHCGAIMALPGLSMMQALRELALYSCRRLLNILIIEELVTLESLESLVILKCEQIEILRYIPMLRNLNLKTLELELQRDVEIPGMRGLQSLERLAIYSEYRTDSKFRGLKMGRNFKRLELFLDRSLPVDDIVRDLSGSLQAQFIVWHIEMNGLLQLLTHQEFTALELQRPQPQLSVESIDEIVNLDNVIICKLKGLVLVLRSCGQLKDIKGISECELLEELTVEDCDALEALPNLARLQKLKRLVLRSCERLKDIKGISECELLEELSVQDCDALEALPNLARLQKLKRLVLRSCGRLKDIKGISECELLEELSIEKCYSLEALPNLARLQKLKGLVLRSCGRLEDIKGISECELLEELSIEKCYSLKALPNLARLQKLKGLVLRSCGRLKDIQGLSECELLEELSIEDCNALHALPNLARFQKLKGLVLRFCGRLKDILGLGECDLLEELSIEDCNKLDALPNLARFQKLKGLVLKLCGWLKDIKGLGECELLEELSVENCGALEALPNLARLRKLKILVLSYFGALKDIQGLGGLESLEELKIEDCDSLEGLPNLSRLQELRKVQLRRCKQIKDIEGLMILENLKELRIFQCPSLEDVRHPRAGVILK